MKILRVIKKTIDHLNGLKCFRVINFRTEGIVSESNLKYREDKLNFIFPIEMRKIYTEEASSINFSWEDTQKVFGASCNFGEFNLLSPTQIEEFYAYMQNEVLISKTSNDLKANEGLKAVVKDWEFWIPIIRFTNGDAFCIDKRNEKIVFLEHDVLDAGPSIHGTIIANDFKDLITKWSQIGFVDVYDWSSVCDADGININNPKFNSLKEYLEKH